MGTKKELDPFYSVDGMARSKNGHSVPFARLTDLQARSRTYQGLSDAAKVTLMICKLCRQYHMNEKDAIQGDVKCFYFNRKLQQMYGLSNPNKARKSMVELIEAGFIEATENGWSTRHKTIFRFSDQWKRLDKGQDIELSAASRAYIQGRKKKSQ